MKSRKLIEPENSSGMTNKNEYIRTRFVIDDIDRSQDRGTQITFKDTCKINSLCLLDGEPFYVVDERKVHSALGNQYQPYYDRKELVYALVYKSLILNHGFANGNKRTAVIVLYLFSRIIGNDIKLSDEELAALTYKIAGENGGAISPEDIAEQVFSYHESTHDITPLSDLEKQTKEYISKHEWLMYELAK